jgi:glutathione-regulated potassium-efflux system ancillary protein KefF
MKHWIDQVLALGWAYGHGGEALRGKTCWWVCSAGGSDPAYALREMHRRPFQDYVPPVEQTARFCGMHWWQPFVVHGAHDITEQELLQASATLQQRCEEFLTAALPEGTAP